MQTLVSVGPYMFITRPAISSLSSRASGGGKASPPTIMRCSPFMPALAWSSISNMRAIDGVHCRCVTLWRLSSAGSVCSVDATLGGSESLRSWFR